jgi:glycosyltransferase involved in cell wall biosynthesis/uncharacterized protein YjbI with pentapeptide repeats
LVAVVLICLQIGSDLSMQHVTDATMQAAELLRKPDVDLQKARQDLITAELANESRGFLGTFAGQLSALLATLVTVSGAMLALRTYLDDRDKERHDRIDAREKERQDRLATSLSEALSRLVGTEERQRIVGAAGLLPFLEEDKSDFHLQALTALLAAARVADEEPSVRQAVRLAIERACRTVNREVLTRVSWQGVAIAGADLFKQDLRKLDFRDADLQDVNLCEANLDEADLRGAKLQGAQLKGASLCGANLAYCDLAGADMSGALLTSAHLYGIKVLKADLTGADFTGNPTDWRTIPWDVTLNWRQARFDDDVRASLDAMYGTEAPAIRVLMLMWEMPPLVAGGTWTASYHLVRNLRRRGADVTVVVPWERELLVDLPFGTDVHVVGLGIRPPAASLTGSSPYGSSAYGYSPYSYSLYGSGSPSPYGSWSPYGAQSYRGGGLAGSVLFRLMGEFGRRLRSYILDNPADLIHAHDWVTFEAARAAAQAGAVPWIAHFHSTEQDRQLANADRLTQRIERGAVSLASRVVAPSQVTCGKLIQAYDASPQNVAVIPNVLSEGPSPISEMGRFESKRVVFIGRLTPQKGVDLFCEVAEKVRSRLYGAQFEAFGEGEQRALLAQNGVTARGPLAWADRGQAFRDANLVVVPSRAEPFGMVILEAMQHRVPVIYPSNSGAAEVLQSGIKVPAEDVAAMVSQTVALLESLDTWEDVVRLEADEIDSYPKRDYEDRVIEVWKSACGAAAPR